MLTQLVLMPLLKTMELDALQLGTFGTHTTHNLLIH